MSSPAVLCAVTRSSRTYTACGRPSPQLYSCVWPFLLPQSLASEYIRPRGLGPVIQISGIDNRSRGQRVLSSLSTADSPSRHVHTPHRTTSAPSSSEAFSVSSETAEASPTSISSSSDSGSTLSSKDYARRNEWRAALRIQRQRLADEADRQMTVLGVKMNEMTGYKAVEQLKDLVHNRESDLRTLRDIAKSAKTAYDDTVSTRAEAARDVNALLERKHSWTDADVSRFTSLVRSDHSSNHAVHLASTQLKEAELAVDKAFSDLTQTILERYHEEQVWSDKIRNVSTWAGVVGLLVNFVVFIGAIAIVEPWKRRRLVERLEERMSGMMEKVEGGVGHLAQRLDDLHVDQSDHSSASTAASLPGRDVSFEWNTPESADVQYEPRWTTRLSWLPSGFALMSQPSVDRDLVAVGICGAAGGAAFISSLSWLFRGR